MILDDRFWSKVQKTSSCWLWLGRLSDRGYGLYGLGGRTRRAHRLAYEAARGPIPEGAWIDHTCRIRHCVNTAHLQAVSPSENQQNRGGAQMNNSSGVRGVSRHRDRWQVNVRVNRRRYYGGRFADIDEAAAAAKDLRNRLMTNNLADQ